MIAPRSIFTCLLAAAVLVLLATAGCEFKGGQAGQVSPADGANGAWQPRAETLRVHASTRFVPGDEERALLQARVEFLDGMGDSIKAVGEYRLELFASDELGRNVGRRLYQWQIDARTLADQYSYYDSVTRSYVFRLHLDDPAPPTQPTLLRVTFIPAEPGERLETTTVLLPA